MILDLRQRAALNPQSVFEKEEAMRDRYEERAVFKAQHRLRGGVFQGDKVYVCVCRPEHKPVWRLDLKWHPLNPME